MSWAFAAAERGVLPDAIICWGIRRLLAERLETERQNLSSLGGLEAFAARLASSPLAVEVERANEQHYEVPPEFFRIMLGPQRKYSSAYWPSGVKTLGEAEERMLSLTAERAQLANGQSILELGCGWGSLSLWMAAHFPKSSILAISNSNSQRETITQLAKHRGLENLRVETHDINNFCTDQRFDRVVSVEMFEHTRNWRYLLGQIAKWLQPSGKLFVHVFSHNTTPYLFEQDGNSDWMARNFFSGGLMPSHSLIDQFRDLLVVEQDWELNGQHYEKTLLAWLEKVDANKREVREVLSKAYGADSADQWLQRWRIFLLACAELFGYRNGEEWQVSHYRLTRP